MPYKIFTLHPGGSIDVEVQKSDPSLDRLQRGVNGYIEEVPLFKTFVHEGVTYRGLAWANEDGRRLGLPVNRTAFEKWREACPAGDPRRMILVGDVLFVAKFKETREQLVERLYKEGK
jgi:Domain of unknown function (DUF3846)